MKQPSAPSLPHQVQAMLTMAMRLEQQGRVIEAERVYRDLLARQPRQFHALHALGLLCCATGRLEEGIAWLEKSVRIDPRQAEAQANLGQALANAGKPAKALACFDRAIALRPDIAALHINRGSALESLGRSNEAIASLDRGIALAPGEGMAHYNRGVSLQSVSRLEEALASYQRATRLMPRFAPAFANLGLVLLELERHAESLACSDAALALDPDHAPAHYNRGQALRRLGRHGEALQSLLRLHALHPDFDCLASDVIATQLQVCDWRDLGPRTAALLEQVARGQTVPSPFEILTLSDDPALQLAAARLYAAARCPPVPGRVPVPPAGARLRVGYFSADFRNHPVSHLMAGLLECHRRPEFEVIGFAFGPPSDHADRRRIEASCDQFHEVTRLSDHDIAALARKLGVDIAVDLSGYTSVGRPGIFAARAAPVQVSYLGYIGTMGAAFMDYLIADKVTVPDTMFGQVAEQVVHLPIFQANRRRDDYPAPARSALGLPDGAFVFCCFNNSFKILPAQFDVWMAILRRVPDSVLWLLGEHDSVAVNLRAEAEARGVAGSRLVFAGRTSFAAYQARYGAADLFLDTLPYNAGATASDALWAGVPVLTRRGASFVGRMAASLLTTLGLPELVTETDAEYEARAVELATDREMLASLAARLRANRDRSGLFAPTRFARTIETAFQEMMARCRAGLPPAPIVVS